MSSESPNPIALPCDTPRTSSPSASGPTTTLTGSIAALEGVVGLFDEDPSTDDEDNDRHRRDQSERQPPRDVLGQQRPTGRGNDCRGRAHRAPQPIIIPRFSSGNSGSTSANALEVRNAAPAPPIDACAINSGTVGASDGAQRTEAEQQHTEQVEALAAA